MIAVEKLHAMLKEEAAVLRRHADERGARMIKGIVERYAAAIAEGLCEELTLDEASRESGYSKSHLRALLNDEESEIVNAGKKRRPRIRRGDLPRKGTSTSRVLHARVLGDAAAASADRIFAKLR